MDTVMNQRDLTLREIREYLAKRQAFTGVPPVATLIVGCIGAAGALAAWLGGLTFQDNGRTSEALGLWLGLLALAIGVYVTGVVLASRKRKSAGFSPAARFAYGCQIVAMLAAAVLTAVLLQGGAGRFVPCAWLVLYGAGAWPAAFVGGQVFKALGAGCIVCGAAAGIWPGLEALWLGIGFGAMHAVLAAGVAITVRG